MPIVHFRDLHTIEYGEAWAYQESLLQESLDRKRQRFSGETGPDTEPQHHLLFCAHPHVYTLGKNGKAAHLLADEARLKSIDATFYNTNRGGDITYHGPGQIVGYPILDLEDFFTDLGRYMRGLEEVIIRTMADWGIHADRLPGATGVWLDVGTSRARKICAMGVRCSRWVTLHGWALNVSTDLSYFGHIVPCGIDDKGVTSMTAELGKSPDEAEVKASLRAHFADVFGCTILEGASTQVTHASHFTAA
jgi:lipoyl(octanoyl) transferase